MRDRKNIPALSFLILVFSACGGVRSSEPPQAPSDSLVVERPDLGRFFEAESAIGAFVMLDLEDNRWIRYNPDRCREGFIPASTFKIFNSMAALDAGAVADEREVLPWDGRPRRIPAWNEDLDMHEAFKRSAVWFYQEMARRIGPERMQAFLERERYGNAQMGAAIDSFWLTGSLRITPDEQVLFLRRLVRNELGFSRRSMDTVKRLMVTDSTASGVVRSKTGWSIQNEDVAHIGWLVGYVERGGRTFLFALNLESNDPEYDMVGARPRILRNILETLNVMPRASATSGKP